MRRSLCGATRLLLAAALAFRPGIPAAAQAPGDELCLRVEREITRLIGEERKRAFYPNLFVERIGENLAQGPGRISAEVAEEMVRSWMAAPGHRRNILNPEFTHAGARGCSHW